MHHNAHQENTDIPKYPCPLLAIDESYMRVIARMCWLNFLPWTKEEVSKFI